MLDHDIWTIILSQRSQQQLPKQATSVDHANSKRRATDLTTEQVASVNTDSRIKK